MHSKTRRICVTLTICALLITTTEPARADPLSGFNLNGLGRSAVIAVVVGIVVVAAVTVTSVYLIVRHDHNITGCATPAGSGLDLQTDGGGQRYTLSGDVAGVKPGERLRVTGKKRKKDAGNSQIFLVEKVAKDYGPCKTVPVSP